MAVTGTQNPSSGETSCGSLLQQLQLIWDEVGVSNEERDKVILQLEQECLRVYKSKLDEASKLRALLLQELADSKSKLPRLLSALGEKSYIDIPEKSSGTIKEQVAAIAPALEQLHKQKEVRIKEFADVQSQIQKICGEITGSVKISEQVGTPKVDENDLSQNKLDEFHHQLQELQKEKSKRLHTVLDYASTIHDLCAVLGMDFFSTITEVSPVLNNSLSKIINNDILSKLARTVIELTEDKRTILQKIDGENSMSLVLVPKQKDAPMDEPVDISLAKAASSGSARDTRSTFKAKRKAGSDDVKTAKGEPAKKVEVDNDSKSSFVKDVPSSSSKAIVPSKASTSKSSRSVLKKKKQKISSRSGQSASVAPVTEDEIRTALQQVRLMTRDLVTRCRERLESESMGQPKPHLLQCNQNLVLDYTLVKSEAVHEDYTFQTDHLLAIDQGMQTSIIQTMPGNLLMGHQSSQSTSYFANHNDIAKRVEMVLQQKVSDHPNWTTPSIDYMYKPLICQICKITINDAERLLVCDACQKGTHLRCLRSFDSKSIPKTDWHCSKCVIARNGKSFSPKYGRVTRSGRVTTPIATSKVRKRMSSEKRAVPNENLALPYLLCASNMVSSHSELALDSKATSATEMQGVDLPFAGMKREDEILTLTYPVKERDGVMRASSGTQSESYDKQVRSGVYLHMTCRTQPESMLESKIVSEKACFDNQNITSDDHLQAPVEAQACNSMEVRTSVETSENQLPQKLAQPDSMLESKIVSDNQNIISEDLLQAPSATDMQDYFLSAGIKREDEILTLTYLAKERDGVMLASSGTQSENSDKQVRNGVCLHMTCRAQPESMLESKIVSEKACSNNQNITSEDHLQAPVETQACNSMEVRTSIETSENQLPQQPFQLESMLEWKIVSEKACSDIQKTSEDHLQAPSDTQACSSMEVRTSVEISENQFPRKLSQPESMLESKIVSEKTCSDNQIIISEDHLQAPSATEMQGVDLLSAGMKREDEILTLAYLAKERDGVMCASSGIQSKSSDKQVRSSGVHLHMTFRVQPESMLESKIVSEKACSDNQNTTSEDHLQAPVEAQACNNMEVRTSVETSENQLPQKLSQPESMIESKIVSEKACSDNRSTTSEDHLQAPGEPKACNSMEVRTSVEISENQLPQKPFQSESMLESKIVSEKACSDNHNRTSENHLQAPGEPQACKSMEVRTSVEISEN